MFFLKKTSMSIAAICKSLISRNVLLEIINNVINTRQIISYIII